MSYYQIPHSLPEVITDNKNENKNLLIRILGNDIPLIHDDSQTYNNLLFTIINESVFKNTDKLYILNRIFDIEKREKLIQLLEHYSIPFLEIQFLKEEFNKISKLGCEFIRLCENLLLNRETDDYQKEVLSKGLYNHRLYISNINYARNYGISYGKSKGYKWIFILDSNNYLTERYFNSIIDNIKSETEYIAIPQIRLNDNSYTNQDILLSPEKLDTLKYHEPQLAFKNTSIYRFNENIPYGTMNKGEFLNSICIPGDWSLWGKDLERLNIVQRKFSNARYQILSKICRLSPGNETNSFKTNWLNRHLGTYLIVQKLALECADPSSRL